MSEFWSELASVVVEVALAVAPVAAVAAIFSVRYLRISRTQARPIFAGLLLTALGVIFFLLGVRIGFMPAGEAIGAILASSSRPWLLIPIGFLLGLLTILAEPTVRVQTAEVARVSGGTIPERLLLATLALGVGAAVAAAMWRVLWNIPLLAILIPGYILAFALTSFVSPAFTSIGFDSGGVATGPITVTFIAAVAIGAARAVPGGDPVAGGFGLVSLVALAPVLSVLLLGVLYGRSQPAQEAKQEEEREDSWTSKSST